MSEEVASADSLLIANAELRRALTMAMQENEQHYRLERQLIAERDQAQADAAAWHRVVAMWRQAGHIVSLDMVRMLDTSHPGAYLLAELTLARHVVEAARREQKIAKHIWTQPGEPTNAVSAFEIALDQALRTYDEATNK